MSLIAEIDDFFFKHGDMFDLETINYTKNIVFKIKSSPTLKNYLSENKIGAQLLLNELTPYCQFKYKEYGDASIGMDEIQSILNIIVFSNELEKMIMNDHIRISSLDPIGDLYYIADEFAANYFNDRFNINMIAGEEFDFTIIDDKNDDDDDNDIGGMSLN